jgi:hypothetical protein
MLESIAWTVFLLLLGGFIAVGIIVAILMMSGDQ